MSFILDALKKSENERARQNGPALLQTRIVPRRPGVPAWAIAIGVVLLANLGVIGYVLLRSAPPASAPATAPTAPTPAPTAAPAAAPAPAPTVQVAPAPAFAPLPETRLSTLAAETEPPVAAVVNPADFQPARPAGTVPRSAPEPASSEQRGVDSALPTAAELSASGLPEMRLALHSFDENPANRYVLLNSQRLREGETMQDGVRVERITADGVILSWRGQRFRLQPGE
jgi:general secretion pathway protein B